MDLINEQFLAHLLKVSLPFPLLALCALAFSQLLVATPRRT
jgi:hypothetical protein